MDLGASLVQGDGSTYSTPRWVKMFGVTAIVLLLLFIGQHLIGGSFLGHMSGGHGDHAPRSTATEHGAQTP